MRTTIVLLVGILAMSGVGAAQTPPAKTTEAVIFADDRYDVVSWAGEPVQTREFFVARGFKPLHAEELADWMAAKAKAGAYGTVALLPTGLVPGPILQGPEPVEGQPGGWDAFAKGWMDKRYYANSVARKYMEAGGRLVFMGDVTFYYAQGAEGPIRCTGGLMPQLVDVHTDQRILYGPPNHEQILTDEGKRWGLTQPWFGMPCNTADVTLTLVAAPRDKASLIFLKTVNPEYPLSGLLSFPIKLRGDEVKRPLLADIYKAANFWGTPVTVPEVARVEKPVPPLAVNVALGETGTRVVYLPEEEITGLVTLANHSGGVLTGRLSVKFSDAAGTYFSEERKLGLPEGDVPAMMLNVPTEGLRRGEYELEVGFKTEVAVGDRSYTAEKKVGIALVARPDQPFFLGVWGNVPANAFRREQYLKELKGYHLNPVAGAGHDDDLLRMGMQFVRRIEAYEGFPNAVDDKDTLLLRRDEKGQPIKNPWRPALWKVSLAHPQVIAGWSEGQREQIKELTRHPAWFPAILTCDDFSAFYGEDFGEYSRTLFTERTGKPAPGGGVQAPALQPPPKGIIPDDNLRLLWREHTMKELGGFINRSFGAAKEEVAPRVPFGPVPGGMMVPVWTEGQYPPADFGGGGFDLLSYYYYNAYWQPEIGNLFFDELAKLGNRNLPLWTTPDLYIAGDEPSYYRNAFFLHLAGGVSGLNYYAYSEHKESAIKEVGRLAGRLEDLGALQVALKPARKRVGLYMPFACNAVNWAYPISTLYAYSNLLCAQVDVEPVCREELLAGEAYGYEALAVWNADWLSQSEADGLKQYMTRGGRVLLDKGSAVELPGAVRLPCDLAMGQLNSNVSNDDPRFAGPGQADYNIAARVAAVREAMKDYITYDVADPTVIVRPFNAAGGTMLWCANVHTNEEYKYLVERMPVYKRAQDRAAAEEEGRKFLRERGAYGGQVETRLTLEGPNTPEARSAAGLSGPGPDTGGAAAGIRPLQGRPLPAAYDLWAGKRLAVTKLPDGRWQVPITMERLGGTLVALYASAPAKVGIQSFPAQVKQGGWSGVDLRLYGENGRLMDSLVPCRVRILDPQGQETWRATIALRDGRHVMRFAPAKNDVSGEWTIEITELAGGVKGTAKITV
ncbi:MAG: hypothetical protein KKI08_24045, partial [Armatimonadetes bacterium]|nr:hypothetical protein [Armatimonadota bacterium]